ncbi:MAG: hypothetical protein KatS3mg085_265 [Candidatus Dojkabacteria bacterium]|nr:MAG: hypothetical protein KatS3mg085_265 [Candidatus Dojkabacteria bacterium]
MKPENVYNVTKWIVSIAGIVILGSFAFSKASRKAIWERAKGVSELSGERTRRMECAHLDHDQTKNYYDDPNNGLLVTIFEHHAHHLFFEGRAFLIGLSEEANEVAIQKTWDRIFEFEKNISEEEAEMKVQEAIIRWANYYRVRFVRSCEEA